MRAACAAPASRTFKPWLRVNICRQVIGWGALMASPPRARATPRSPASSECDSVTSELRGRHPSSRTLRWFSPFAKPSRAASAACSDRVSTATTPPGARAWAVGGATQGGMNGMSGQGICSGAQMRRRRSPPPTLQLWGLGGASLWCRMGPREECDVAWAPTGCSHRCKAGLAAACTNTL